MSHHREFRDDRILITIGWDHFDFLKFIDAQRYRILFVKKKKDKINKMYMSENYLDQTTLHCVQMIITYGN